MNLRDLTPEEANRLIAKSDECMKAYFERQKAAHRTMQTKEEIWRQAFSDGVKAALAHREE